MLESKGWEGAKEFADALKHLDQKMGNSILRSWNRDAAKKVILPNISPAIHSKRAKEGVKVMASKGDKRAVIAGPVRSTYWETMLQKGTVKRTTKKGYNRGSIREDFKLQKAYEELFDPVVDHQRKNAGSFIVKTLNRKLKTVNRKLSRFN